MMRTPTILERKIKVPEGMLRAALYAITRGAQSEIYTKPEDAAFRALNGALVWLSENPLAPTDEQLKNLREDSPWHEHQLNRDRWMATEWQRRMFVEPEPEVPQEIRDLLWDNKGDQIVGADGIDARILEAYRRGQHNFKGDSQATDDAAAKIAAEARKRAFDELVAYAHAQPIEGGIGADTIRALLDAMPTATLDPIQGWQKSPRPKLFGDGK